MIARKAEFEAAKSQTQACNACSRRSRSYAGCCPDSRSSMRQFSDHLTCFQLGGMGEIGVADVGLPGADRAVPLGAFGGRRLGLALGGLALGLSDLGLDTLALHLLDRCLGGLPDRTARLARGGLGFDPQSSQFLGERLPQVLEVGAVRGEPQAIGADARMLTWTCG